MKDNPRGSISLQAAQYLCCVDPSSQTQRDQVLRREERKRDEMGDKKETWEIVG